MLAGGWLGKEPSKKPEATQQLTFSFQVQLQDKGSSAGPHTPWQIPASSAQGVDEGTLLRQALMGLDQRGGLYLTPVLYRPTVQVGLKQATAPKLCTSGNFTDQGQFNFSAMLLTCMSFALEKLDGDYSMVQKPSCETCITCCHTRCP